ncbi:MAG: hypothetical protein ACFFAN_10635 [Promethearchaeota archaeon]
MEIYEDLIEKDEEILWKKKFPPKNIIPKRKKFIWERNYFLILWISASVVFIIFIVFLTFTLILYSDNRSDIELGILILVILIIITIPCILLIPFTFRSSKSELEDELTIFQEYLRYYKEEDLRNHPKYYIITNKKILTNDRYHMEARYYISEIDNVIEIKKDFLVMNLNYLYRVLIKEYSRKINTIYFRFNTRLNNILNYETEEATAFIKLSKQEYSEILKILFNLVPNLIVDTQ